MRLVYQSGDGMDVAIELAEKPVVIGRSPEADIVLEDQKVSRLHCGVRPCDGHYRLEDLGSRNGTFLNTGRISTGTSLHPGDQIRVGEKTITVEAS